MEIELSMLSTSLILMKFSYLKILNLKEWNYIKSGSYSQGSRGFYSKESQ